MFHPCPWRTTNATVSLVAAVFLTGSASATVLRLITEDDQIRQSQTIFRGRAEKIDVARESRGEGLVVVSTVRFQPLAVYKGSPPSSVILKFLGGKIDGKTMKVDGMPRFDVGGEYVLFVSAGTNRACPIVGWSDGSLTVDRQKNPAGVVSVASDKTGASPVAVVSARRHTLPDGRDDLPAFEKRLRARVDALRSQP